MATDVDLPITGGCGCGAVRFEIDAPLQSALYCHCTRCQHRTGTAAAASARPAPGSLRVVSGQERVRALAARGRPGQGLLRRLRLGPLRVGPRDAARCMVVRFGAFDGDPGIRPGARQFVDYAAPWEPIPDDGLPRFPERRPD